MHISIGEDDIVNKKDGLKGTSAKEKAETMDDYFSSVFTKENLQYIPSAPITPVQDILTAIEIIPEIVRTKLKDRNPSKLPGHDKWHPNFLRVLADNLCLPLSILLNKSVKEGAHTSWLKAVITPIYKKGSRCIPANYRPVSITSVISKIMESILRDEIKRRVRGSFDEKPFAVRRSTRVCTRKKLCNNSYYCA